MITGNTTLERLKTLEEKKPKRIGAYWKGMPHGQLAYNLLAACAMRRWYYCDLYISVSNDLQDMAIGFQIDIRQVKTGSSHWKLGLGMTHSNSGHKRLRLYVGLMSHDNAITLARIPLTKCKHTHKVKMSALLDYVLDRYLDYSKQVPTVIKQLVNAQLTHTDVDRLLMAAGRMHVMPWSRIGKVDNLYTNGDKSTSWELLTAFGYAVKLNPPLIQMEQMAKFASMLPGITPNAPSM